MAQRPFDRLQPRPKPGTIWADFALFVAKAREYVQDLSPASDLYVLIWPNAWIAEKKQRFDALGIPYRRGADQLPGFEKE